MAPSSGSYITATGFSGNLKIQYDPVMVDLFNLTPGLYTTLPELAGYSATGAGYYFSTKMRPNRRGLGARGEGDTLPTAGNVKYLQGNATCYYNYAAIETTGPAVARTAKGGGYVDVLADDITTSTEVLLKDLARQAWRAGTGKITETTAAGVSATSMTVESCRHLEPEDYIEVYTSAGGAEITSTRITNIDYPNRTLTIADSSSWSDGSYVYRDGQYNSGTALEMMGLDGIVEDTSATFEGIDASTYYEWKSYVESSAGDIDRESLWKAIYFTEAHAKGVVDEIWTTEAQRQKIFMMIQPAVQYNQVKNLELAFEEKNNPLTFDGRTFYIDHDCPSGKIFGLCTGSDRLGTITEKKLGIGTVIDEVNNTFLRTASKDSYTLFVSIYQNIVCKDRRSFFKIEGLNDLYDA